ncbi:hypothetical protein [Paraburkholderia susongensis]|uniref:Uncharacterized protein n=1 Tax=Paraburkholderia susongensis TaxID=1515439 RepID=A0A1X7JFE2_9BURK|nr:hypothetical protein [Paraburkholderia susongensis]SMG26464.1 hypothetical protein SAMN06265784_102534 [Paraburkholderia susongensis]
MSQTVHPGTVAWTGDNPGIYLKETDDGEWSSLAAYFKINYSSFGMGKGVLLLEKPNVAASLPEACNVCIADNEALARYLMEHFFSRFAAFRASVGTAAIQYLPLTDSRSAGDTRSRYQEILLSGDLEVVMTWNRLGTPYAVDMPAEKGPTQKHEMYSLFIDAADASIELNGRALRGKVTTRNFDGGKKSSAFLAFSESWMEMP